MSLSDKAFNKKIFGYRPTNLNTRQTLAWQRRCVGTLLQKGSNVDKPRESGRATVDAIEPDRRQAERFLRLLDPSATSFTFQTFDDNKERHDKRLARVLHGTLADRWGQLASLNARGAGIFVCVNETDGQGRTEKNIERVRALFVDLDGAPLDPVRQSDRPPHIMVASSPGRWQAFWLATIGGIKLDQFSALQKGLAARYGGDDVHDLPRVMRLPGSLHCKGQPHPVHIVGTTVAAAVTAADFQSPSGDDEIDQSTLDDDAGRGTAAEEPSSWKQLNDQALAKLELWVPELFPNAKPYRDGYRVTSADLGRNLQEDLSLIPDGIKDFGVHDLGDEREGKRSPIDVVMEHGTKSFDDAVVWLQTRLGSDADAEHASTEEAQAHAEPSTAPVDLWNTFAAPPLPTGLLPKLIEDFAFEQGVQMGADPAGLALSALAVCAAAIPDRVKLKVKRHTSWKESTRLWVGLVGDPSSKKTPMIYQAARPLARIDTEMWRAYVTSKARWEALSKEEKQRTAPPKQTRIRIEDTTIEAAQEVLKDSPDGVLCLRDEMSGWFGSMDKYAGHRGAAMDRGFWLQAWNGGTYSYNRVSRGAGLIENLSVCVLGGIQPEPMRKLASDSVDDGLIQRIIPIMVRRGAIGTDEPTPDTERQYDALVIRLHGLKPFDDVHLSDEARAIRQELEQKHHEMMACETINKKLAAHIGKYDGIFARLCLLWHCIENADGDLPAYVSEATARQVATFLHAFLLPHAMAFYASIFGLSDDNDRLRSVAGYILAHKVEIVTNRVIQRGDRTMRGLGARDVDNILQQLDALGWLNRVQGPRLNIVRWNVNPEVHALYRERAEQEAERRRREREMIAAMVGSRG
jgi:hypothetical protein